MKENPVQDRIRLEAAQLGIDLWRNNSGVLPDQNGRPVRYGLCNDNPKLNKEVKSSDLIGITPVFITPEMIGMVLGVFTAIEVKKSDWKWTPDERTLAQQKFIDIVCKSGGYAGFATSTTDFRKIIKK